MNNIPAEQNAERQLQRLAAQRNLYSNAKRVFGAQLILGIPIALCLALVVAVLPSAKGFVAFCGVIISLCDVLWLNLWQKRLRERAAKIQEAFDCDVLHLPWNDIKVGSKPDPEMIKEWAEKPVGVHNNLPPIRDWYGQAVGELPLDVARVLCQRSNCWWDAKQRRRYAALVIGVIVVTVILIFGIGIAGGLTVEKLFLAIIAPLSPAIIIGFRQFVEHNEAANRLDNLKGHSEKLWSDALRHAGTVELTAKSRVLQDELFENRRKSPLVFDWIFQRLRDDYEAQMNHGVKELVEEAKRELGLS